MTTSFRGKFPELPGGRAGGSRQQDARKRGLAQKIFPSDLGAHYTLFSFHTYTFTRNAPPRRELGPVSIALPPPQSMREIHNIDYNNSELGVVGGQLTDLAMENVRRFSSPDPITQKNVPIMSVLGGIVDQAKSRFDTFKNANLADKLAVGSAPLRQGTNALGAGLNLAFGNSPNPHVTAVFRSVQLNSHTFTWNLSPRSRAESFEIANIISEFKRAALPDFIGTGGFAGALLTFPKIVQIHILGSINKKFQTEYKDCVIKSISAEYAPNGPSFFASTGAPTHITLTLNVQEIQIHTASDHPATDDPVAAETNRIEQEVARFENQSAEVATLAGPLDIRRGESPRTTTVRPRPRL